MIDFHSHILPKMDDGSHSSEESLQMLHMLSQQGVHTVVATPHFYADADNPQHFLAKRALSWARLQEKMTPDLPRVHLGAEVCYYEGIARGEDIAELCLQNTRVLLLEMPFSPWSDRMLYEVSDLMQRQHLCLVLAHIERYLPFLSQEQFTELQQEGFLIQCNATFFLNWRTRRTALRMLRRGEIQLLGSDCHGSDYRPPRMAEAAQYISGKLGQAELDALEQRAAQLLKDAE